MGLLQRTNTPEQEEQNDYNKIGVYSIYDSKAQSYLPPFLARSPGLACRMMITAAIDEGHELHKFAADYTLFRVGTWDEQLGTIKNLDAFQNLGTALMARDIHEQEQQRRNSGEVRNG